jgi:hypothetical protein
MKPNIELDVPLPITILESKLAIEAILILVVAYTVAIDHPTVVFIFIHTSEAVAAVGLAKSADIKVTIVAVALSAVTIKVELTRLLNVAFAVPII